MSSSKSANTKIEFLDDRETVRTKIFNAYCEDGIIRDNGVLGLLKDVIFPICEIQAERGMDKVGLNLAEGQGIASGGEWLLSGNNAPKGTIFTIDTLDGGKPLYYEHYEELETHFANGTFGSNALKSAVTKALDRQLEPIRKMFMESREWQAVDKLVYPECAPGEL